MSASIEQRNQEATCYVGNLDERVNEEILWELMTQCGPVVNVHMPKDKVSGKHIGYGFVEFRSEEDAEYCMKVMNMVRVYQKPIKLNKATPDKKQQDVGANVFIGNLDQEVDEKLLHDTFSAFGGLLSTPKIMRDPQTGVSKGYGFISYDSFESSDNAIACMNGQYFANRPVVVQYAFKKDTPGERHGSQAERLIAASKPSKFRPNTIFAGGQGDAAVQIGSNMAPSYGYMGGYDPSQQAGGNTFMNMGLPGVPPMPPMHMSMGMSMGMPMNMMMPMNSMAPPPPPPGNFYSMAPPPPMAMPPPPPMNQMMAPPPPPSM